MTAIKNRDNVADRIIKEAEKQQRSALLEPEAKTICRAYGLPLLPFEVATNKKQAVDFAEKLGYPVVLKIVSPDIMHKTEAGGVLLDLNSTTEVEEGYERLLSNAKMFKRDARIVGVLIQHMAAKGLEVIVGGLRDSQFGAVVMFGLGGIFTEVLEDVTFGITPVSNWDAREMIRCVRANRILTGFRGQPPVDEGVIATIICGVSTMMDENPSIGQLDLNPVMVGEHECSIVDARIVLVEEPSRQPITSESRSAGQKQH
jgi:acetyl-CoA synthetase (ADP-forming)